MRSIILISHGPMADGVKSSLEMIVGQQKQVHVVSMPADGDNVQFEKDLSKKIGSISGQKLIIVDLLGGTPCNVALTNYAEDEEVTIIAGMNLPIVLEAAVNEKISLDDLIGQGKRALVDAKAQLQATKLSAVEKDSGLERFKEYQGKANLVNVRIDERLIHGQVAGIWTTSLNSQRIIVANDEAAANSLQKSSLRMAAPASMRLSVLPVAQAAENINSGKYGLQRIFLLFKNPADVLKFINAGGKLETVNVGNMSYKEGSIEVTKSIKIMPDEKEVFKEISDKGVKITAQLVPSDPVVDFIEKLNKI